MKEQFATYEIALKLRALGFDEECLGIYIYINNKRLLIDANSIWYNHCRVGEFILAPLWQQVVDWLRKVHNIILEINYSDCEFWQYIIITKNTWIQGTNEIDDVNLTHGEIREIGLKEALKLIKR